MGLATVLFAAACGGAGEFDTDISGPLAMDGNTLVASDATALPSQSDSTEQLAIGVRDGDEWVEQARFALELPGDFAHSIAVSGSTVAAGRPVFDGSINEVAPLGAAHVFVQSGNGWAEEGELASGVERDEFGADVDIEGDTLVVGAPFFCADMGEACGAGAAYVFGRSAGGWQPQAVIRSTDNRAENGFGNCVAIAGSTLVAASQAGLEVFVRSGDAWVHQQTLTLNNAPFVIDVALDGETIAATTYPAEDAVQLFERQGDVWSPAQRLTPETGDERFGAGISLAGDVLAITTTQSLRVFERADGAWTKMAEVLAEEDTHAEGEFHGPVAASGETVAAVLGLHPTTEIYELGDLRGGGCSVPGAGDSRYVVHLGLLVALALTRRSTLGRARG